MESHRNAEALGVAGQRCQSHLSSISDGEWLSRCDKAGEGRIWSGWPEEIKERRRSHESHGRCRIAVGHSKALAESAWSNQEDAAGARWDATIWCAARDDNGERVRNTKPGGYGVESVLSKQMWIRAIQILRMIQVHAARPLVSKAEFPGAGDFTLDRKIPLIRVTIDEILCD